VLSCAVVVSEMQRRNPNRLMAFMQSWFDTNVRFF